MSSFPRMSPTVVWSFVTARTKFQMSKTREATSPRSWADARSELKPETERSGRRSPSWSRAGYFRADSSERSIKTRCRRWANRLVNRRTQEPSVPNRFHKTAIAGFLARSKLRTKRWQPRAGKFGESPAFRSAPSKCWASKVAGRKTAHHSKTTLRANLLVILPAVWIFVVAKHRSDPLRPTFYLARPFASE